jgi:hypothetical protein
LTVFSLYAQIRRAQVSNFLLHETHVPVKLEAFLFGIVNASAGFILHHRNARIAKSRTESLQSSQPFLKAKLGTKVPQGANAARIDVAPLHFERRNEFRKNRRINRVSPLVLCFIQPACVVLE